MPDHTSVDIPSSSLVQTEDPRDTALIRSLEAFLPELLRLNNTPGMNIALARHGEIVWEGAYGYADATRRVATTLETVFRSGSMGKTYTAGAIMQLVERGAIRLEDPINKSLPFKVENPLGGPEITIFHLLTHTSGLGGDSASSVFGNNRPLEETVRSNFSRDEQPGMGGVPTWAVPTGDRGIYSNLAIATLGLIVQLTNPEELSFSDYVEQNIMIPLGMTSTQYPPAQSKEHVRPEIWERMSTGYNPIGNVWIPTPLVYFEEFPAGGFVSIPRDHLRFVMTMMNGGSLGDTRILEKETVTRMLTPQREGTIEWLGSRERQGLVWRLRDWDTRDRAFWHTGGHMFGWRTSCIAWPGHETAAVFACNDWGVTGKGRMPGVDTFIESWLRAEPPVFPALPDDVDNLAWKASYVRGLLFVEAYRYGVGLPEKLDLDEARRLASEAVVETWSGNDSLWDPEAFVQGISDMNEVAPTQKGVRGFANSDRKRVTLGEAERIYPYLLTHAPERNYANLAGLLAEPAE
jgi:CubicO group peptidase (beta-lactamase class C family)